jgi:hypothetical protein
VEKCTSNCSACIFQTGSSKIYRPQWPRCLFTADTTLVAGQLKHASFYVITFVELDLISNNTIYKNVSKLNSTTSVYSEVNISFWILYPIAFQNS